MAECDFRKSDRPAYSPDITPCDFFLFGYLHEKMIGTVYKRTNELEEKIRVIIEAIPKSRLIALFRE
jgi:hypothetical protein